MKSQLHKKKDFSYALLVSLMTILLSLTLPTQAASTEQSTLLRPGDVIQILFPGEPDFDDPFVINSQGQILLPEVGELNIAKKNLSTALASVRQALAPIYRNLGRTKLLIKERRLAIMVLGYVKHPGEVALPNGATIQMALNEAGGLAPGAQLDRLQVRRGEQVVTFDYKAYLDSGNPNLLPVLKPMDQVFVPASPLTGNVQVEFDARTLTSTGDAADEELSVTVFGEVHRPGTFAYKSGMEVIDMLMRAGGVTRYAGIEQIRVVSAGNPHPFNMREFLDTGARDLMPNLSSGDLIFVPQATDQIRMGARTVFVMGEVFKPGAFESKPGASFMDILANAGGPTRFAETRQIRILHTNGQTQPFDLQAYTEGLSGVSLPQISPGDAILIPEKTDMNEKSWLKISPNRAVRIIGAVVRPGRYEWSSEMNLMDLIAHAGGPVAAADTAHLQIIRDNSGRSKRDSRNGTAKTTPPIKFSLKRYLSKGDVPLPEIKAGDTIVIQELPKDPNDNRSQWVRQASSSSIYIMGQVGAPGRYAFNNELNFLDIITAAQGPTSRADLSQIRISHRGNSRGNKRNTKMNITRVNLSHYFETGDESLLPIVMPEDVIYVPDRGREWLEVSKEITVRVLGEVRKPGRYKFSDDMTILDLLAEAGGPLGTALQDKIVVVNKATGGSQATTFDLEAFAKTADFSKLPVLRSGDTVYVPGQEQSNWTAFSKTLQDTLNVLAFFSFF